MNIIAIKWKTASLDVVFSVVFDAINIQDFIQKEVSKPSTIFSAYFSLINMILIITQKC